VAAQNKSLNGGRGGRPKGIPADVKPFDHEHAIEAAVERALTGKRITPAQFKIGPPSKADCERLSRAINMPIEEFNQKLAVKLANISDKIAQRIEEKIDGDEFKPGELGFIFSVTEDKRRALDARAQLGSAQVNIQVNNYGDKSREEIIAALLPPVEQAPAFSPDIDLDNLRPEDVI